MDEKKFEELLKELCDSERERGFNDGGDDGYSQPELDARVVALREEILKRWNIAAHQRRADGRHV